MFEIEVLSQGFDSTIDVTDQITALLKSYGAQDGLVSAMVIGSTAGIAVMRYEPGAVDDLLEALKRMAPPEIAYRHFDTTGDPNGAAHVKSALLGTSICFPFRDGRVAMSDSHRIVLVDFDLRPATRTICLQPHAGTSSSQLRKERI